MIQFIRLCLLLWSLALGSVVAAAQTDQAAAPAIEPPPPSEQQVHLSANVQQLADKLTGIEKQLDVTRPSQSLLKDLGSQITPLATEAQAEVDRLAPRVTAMKARLDQLGAKPEKGENADITKERETLEKSFADNDGLYKRAKVLAVKAQQDANYVAKRQRTLFTNSLFQRTTSLLNPPLWFTVIGETPENIGDTVSLFHQWIDAFNSNVTGGKLVAFWAVIMGLVLLYWPMTWAARRFVAHEDKIEAPSDWQKVMAALWTALSVSGLMIAVMYAVVYVFTFMDMPDTRLQTLYSAMQWGVIRIALAVGLSRALLTPHRPKWRLANVDDKTADKLVRIAIGVALIASAGRLIEALNDVISASLDFALAMRGVDALLVAISLAVALVGLGSDPEADNPESDADASTPSQRRDIYGLVRGLTWAMILVTTGAAIVGYVAFASFLVEQVTLLAAVGTMLFLLTRLVDESCALGLQPTSRVGRSLIYTVGIRRETLEQLPVVLSGAGRITLFGLALLIVAAPWGMQSTDLSSNLSAIFFGFKVGDFTISLQGIAIALISFLMVLAATRAIQNWLEDRYLPTTRLDAGLRNSIKTSLGYVGFIIALAIGAGNLGLDFQKLAIVAGALSVGIGFGLQSIVNNFVSGLILLWERAVRVGDWVVVGSDQGYVRKINVRSTEIETFDRAAVIVPNSNLVSGVVKNLMRTDRVGRLQIELNVHASADPEEVRRVLLEITGDNEAILSLPSPAVRFTNLTSTAMTFDLFCYVADVESALRTKSDLYFEICKQFRKYKFFDGPAPDPTQINILGLDRLEEIIKSRETPGPNAAPARPRKAG